MTVYQTILVLATVFMLSVGQVLFKLSSSVIVFDISKWVSFLNPKFIFAIAVYFFATVMWLYVLKQLPLRVAYPFIALAFVIVPIMAHFLLGEKLELNTFVGALIIIMGVLISTYK